MTLNGYCMLTSVWAPVMYRLVAFWDNGVKTNKDMRTLSAAAKEDIYLLMQPW